jgi:isoquinoline 1-oxidoreductase beta subunit
VLEVFRVEGPEPGAPYTILASGVAVVATSTWAALQGRKALKVEWSKGPHALESTRSFWRQAEGLLAGNGQVVRDDGDFELALKSAEQVVTARYQVPFVNHAPMEPQNCFADVRRDSALTNAIFNASGVRIRKLPVKNQLRGAFERRPITDTA